LSLSNFIKYSGSMIKSLNPSFSSSNLTPSVLIDPSVKNGGSTSNPFSESTLLSSYLCSACLMLSSVLLGSSARRGFDLDPRLFFEEITLNTALAGGLTELFLE
jgi:hypothetical protein